MLMADVMCARSTRTFFVISVENMFVVNIESTEIKKQCSARSVRKKENLHSIASEHEAILSLPIRLLRQKDMRCKQILTFAHFVRS